MNEYCKCNAPLLSNDDWGYCTRCQRCIRSPLVEMPSKAPEGTGGVVATEIVNAPWKCVCGRLHGRYVETCRRCKAKNPRPVGVTPPQPLRDIAATIYVGELGSIGVLFFREDDWWIAQTLEYDMCVQSRTLGAAFEDIRSCADVSILVCEHEGVPIPATPAPLGFWDRWRKASNQTGVHQSSALNTGVPITLPEDHVVVSRESLNAALAGDPEQFAKEVKATKSEMDLEELVEKLEHLVGVFGRMSAAGARQGEKDIEESYGFAADRIKDLLPKRVE